MTMQYREGMRQRFIPMLSYEDGLAAMDWLQMVFNFSRSTVLVDEDGRLTHGELNLDDQMIMISSASPNYQNPRRIRENYPPAEEWLRLPYIFDGVLVYVNDLDLTFERAGSAGAEILSEIESGYPGRRFRMADLEGHRWFVFQADA